MIKNVIELPLRQERVKHDVNIETLGAMTAPAIRTGANITTAEDAQVGWIAQEALHNLKLIERTQKAEVIDFACKEVANVVLEVRLKLEALGILVINRSARNITLISGRFVRKHDVGLLVEVGHDDSRESKAGRERNVAIVIAEFVHFEKMRIEREVEVDNVAHRIAGRADTFDGGGILRVDVTVED